MEDLCFNDEMSDCRIICEDQIFPCHKFILSVRSDVFKTMFQTMDMQEGISHTVNHWMKLAMNSSTTGHGTSVRILEFGN